MRPSPHSTCPDDPAAWRVLLVDDDPAVLRLTELILSGVIFDGRPLRVLTAQRGEEARALLSANPNVAVAVIDVIMETEQAGVELVGWMCSQPELIHTRRVIHSGQPGRQREECVQQQAEVHDYWAKGTLRAGELRRRFLHQLRTYRDATQAAVPDVGDHASGGADA